MKIALVSPAWPGEDLPNGIVTAVRNLRAGFLARGHEVIVISLRAMPGPDDEEAFALPPAEGGLGAKVLRKLRGRSAHDTRLRAAAREAERRGADVILMEESFGWADHMRAVVKIPVVITLHGPWFMHQDLQGAHEPTPDDARRIAAEGAAIRGCAGITAPSRDVLARSLAHYVLDGKTPPAVCIPNPIAPGAPIDHDALPPEAWKRLLFVGRFDRHKGGDVMLEAFAKLIADGADAHLTFVGPDRGLQLPDGGVRSLDEALALLPEAARARIERTGPLPHPQVEALRRSHPVVAIASRYENLNYTLLETLASGAAAVCTAVGGPAETVRDGETGLLIPPGDAAALAAACGRLLTDPGLARQLGQAARALIFERYTPEPIAEEMIAFIHALGVRG